MRKFLRYFFGFILLFTICALAYFIWDRFFRERIDPTPTHLISDSRQLIRQYLVDQFIPYHDQGLTLNPIKEFENYSGSMKDQDAFLGIKIENGAVYTTVYGPESHLDWNVKQIVYLLDKVVKKYNIPDLEMLLFLGDGITLPDTFKSPIFTHDVKKSAADRAKHFIFPDVCLIRYLKRGELSKVASTSQNYPWNQKIERFFFRGSTTGGSYNLSNILRLTRPKLVFLSILNPDIIDARFTKLVQFGDDESSQKAKKFLELVAPPLPWVSMEDHLAFKYLLCVDGNVGAWGRPLWIMGSNSVLVYHTNFIQWVNPAMKPFTHYIPIQEDLSDLYTVFQWLQSHDDQAKQIVRNANALVDDTLQEEDILDDLAFYLNEYATLCRWDLEQSKG